MKKILISLISAVLLISSVQTIFADTAAPKATYHYKVMSNEQLLKASKAANIIGTVITVFNTSHFNIVVSAPITPVTLIPGQGTLITSDTTQVPVVQIVSSTGGLIYSSPTGPVALITVYDLNGSFAFSVTVPH